jgi:hypothetical protein
VLVREGLDGAMHVLHCLEEGVRHGLQERQNVRKRAAEPDFGKI